MWEWHHSIIWNKEFLWFRTVKALPKENSCKYTCTHSQNVKALLNETDSNLQSPTLSRKLLHSSSAPWEMDYATNLIHNTSLPTKHLSEEALVFLKSLTAVMLPTQEPGQEHTGISSGQAEVVHPQLQQSLSRETVGLSDEQSVYLSNTPPGNSCVGQGQLLIKYGCSIYFFPYLPLYLRKSPQTSF